MIEIVSATRRSEAEFWENAPLGISLRRLAEDQRLVPRIKFENTSGLPVVYHERIEAAANEARKRAEEDIRNAKNEIDLAKAQGELAAMAAQIAALRKFRRSK